MGTGEQAGERTMTGTGEQVRPVINVIVRKLCALADFPRDGVEEGPAGARASVHRLPGSGAVPAARRRSPGRGGVEHAGGCAARAELRDGRRR